MGITDLSSYTSKQGVTTAVWRYDEADTFVVQHDFMHLSFFETDFREFVDTLVVALRAIDRDNPIRHIHPVTIREADSSVAGSTGPDLRSGEPAGAKGLEACPAPAAEGNAARESKCAEDWNAYVTR